MEDANLRYLGCGIMEKPGYSEADSRKLIEYWREVEQSIQLLFPGLYMIRDDFAAKTKKCERIVVTED